MRRSALVLIIAANIAGAGPAKKAEPLPPLNEKVAAFARSNLGKPVGDGICITLAIEALRDAGARGFPLSDPKGDYVWGAPVAEFKDALPGDILQFRDAVFHGKRSVGRTRYVTWHHEYPHHTAIVARVEQGGKLIAVYHQNVDFQGKESDRDKVQEGELRMDSLQPGGWVKIYRPVPPAPPDRPSDDDAGPGR